jgi:hypothetical protein
VRSPAAADSARSSPVATRFSCGSTKKRCDWIVALLVALALVVAPGARAAFQPIDLRVDGGEDNWHAQRLFALRWSNPPGVAAVHFRVLDPDGAVALDEARLAGAATAIQHVSVPPTPGAYTAEVWLERGDGSEGERVDATLRFDDAKPGAVEPRPTAGWIGRTAFPYTLHIGHPDGTTPLSGIRGYAVSVDGFPSGSPCAGELCGDAEIDIAGGIEVDSLPVGELPEGSSFVHAVAVSGSGVASAVSGNAVLRVDKTDPAVSLDGNTSGWSSAPVRLTARASDGASGMARNGSAGPLTAIRVDGGPPTVAAGDTVSTTVISSGTHQIAFYARDAAGNVADGGISNGHANRDPAMATVRIDREPPELSFVASQDPSDPERIEARASDRYAGLDPARGSIAVRRVGGERFAPLPTELSNGALRARWDSAAYPAGEYEFRATAYDRAGNASSTTSRPGGAPMRLQSPLKLPVRMVTKVQPRIVPYGRGIWFGGRLIAARHSPLAGVAVQVVERFEAGGIPGERRTTTRSDGRGRFGVHLPPGPTRQVVAIVAPTATLQGASSEPLALAVHSRVALRVSSTRARVGGAPVVFGGKVAARDAAIPADGKVIELQFRLPGGEWTEFRAVRTDRRGRFRYAYRFSDDDSRGVRFQFRAYAPAQAGWPFEPAGSRPVAVRGT